MDIFAQKKLLIRIIIVLVAVNILFMGFVIWKEVVPPRKPQQVNQTNSRDVSDILEKELNLNPDQVNQIRRLRSNFAMKEQELTAAIRSGRDSMNNKMFKEDLNEEAIKSLARQISDLEYTMEMLRFEQAKALRSICSPEQAEKFNKLVKEIRDYFRPENKQGRQQGRQPGREPRRNPPKRDNVPKDNEPQ